MTAFPTRLRWAPAFFLLAACSSDRLMTPSSDPSVSAQDPSPMVAEATFAAG